MKRVKLFLLVLFFLVSRMATGQTVFDWENTTDGTFTGGGFNRWYDNFLATFIQNEPIGPGVILRFNNNNQPATNNNVPGTYSIYQLIFGSGNSTSRTISGNPIRLFNYLGSNSRIENQSTATHTISTPLEGDGNPAYPLEFNPQGGNLIISSTINNQGSPVHVLGGAGRTLELNGNISGTGGFELQQNSFVILLGIKTYTGATTLRAGVVRISSNVHPSLDGPFGNNAGNLFLAGGSIQNSTGTFNRPITISGNGSNLDAFASARTMTAPISAAAGNWNFSVGATTFPSANGQPLTLSGPITNGAGTLSLTKTGNSTCILSGSNSFSGGVTISGGILTIQTAAALPSGGNVTLSGGALQVGSVAAASTLNAGMLQMSSSSTIDLGTATNPFDLVFSGSGPSFSGTLTINNWSAVNGKRIRITNTTHINTVLGQIQFTGYTPGAVIRNGDELWPAGLYFTQASGNFGDGATWVGGVVPPANSSIVINSGHSVQVDANYSLRSIDVFGGLSCNSNHTITLGNGFSKISNAGTIVFNAGTIQFNNSGGYVDGANGCTFNNVQLNGPLNLLRQQSINGLLQLNTGASVTGTSPVYGTSSTLLYNSGGQYFRNVEWTTNTGAGYPANIILQNSTELRFESGPVGSDIGCSGSLTIEQGSHLNINFIWVRLRIIGNIFIRGTLSLSGGISPGANLFIAGDWNRTATGVVNFNTPPNARTVVFNGATNTFITGPAGQTETFPYLTIFKGVDNTLTLNNPVHIISGLTLSFGKIISTTTNVLSLGDLAAPPGGSVSSFVSGPFKKIGRNFPAGNPFIFPVGKIVGSESHYRPLTISPPTTFTHEYTVEFQRQSSYTQGNISAAAMAEGLSTISRCEYWDFTRSAGSANVNVTLTWSNHPSGRSQCGTGAYITDLTKLWVVPYYNGEWGDQSLPYYGRSSTSGSANPTVSPFLSSITWNNPVSPTPPDIDSYMKFTLGSTDWRFNPLPFELLKFEARKSERKTVILDWTTIENERYKEFIVEVSFDGVSFLEFSTVKSFVGVSQANYTAEHRNPVTGWNYFRIVAVDFQEQKFISKTIRISFDQIRSRQMVFPNPITEDQFNVNLDGLSKGIYRIQLFGQEGRLIHSQAINYSGYNSIFTVQLPSSLPAGVYWLKILGEKSNNLVFKLVK